MASKIPIFSRKIKTFLATNPELPRYRANFEVLSSLIGQIYLTTVDSYIKYLPMKQKKPKIEKYFL